MTPTRFWVCYGAAVLLITAGLLLLTAVDPGRWWPLWLATLTVAAAGAYLLSVRPGRSVRWVDVAALRACIVPVGLTAGGSLFVREFLGGHFGMAGSLATGVGAAAVLYSQAVLADGLPTGHDAARLITNLGAYCSGFLLFAAIQSLALPAPAATALLGGTGGLLASELFHDRQVPGPRQALYGALVALLIAEVSFVAGFLPWGKVLVGLVLLLSFYLLSGLISNHLHRSLTRWVAAEFVGVTLVALVLVYSFHGFGG